MAYKNKEDQRVASKRHYLKYKIKYLERNRLYRLSIREYMQYIKEANPCIDCGVKYPYYIMDFDHLVGKDNEINYLASSGRIGALKREIKKCEIVCANCHRMRTFRRSQNLRARSSAD